MSSDPTERPQDRADVARFYAAASPSFVFNMAARQVAAAQGSSLSENARALALLNMATNDSLVASFWTKYHYNLWRPETAIFEGNLDGNARTDADPTYVPYILTPCFPSYPSNHGSASNSAAEVLKRVYGAGGHEAVGRSRDHEEIGRHDLADVIPQSVHHESFKILLQSRRVGAELWRTSRASRTSWLPCAAVVGRSVLPIAVRHAWHLEPARVASGDRLQRRKKRGEAHGTTSSCGLPGTGVA